MTYDKICYNFLHRLLRYVLFFIFMTERYILDYATMCDGIVVSMDQYRDLYMEKPEWKNTIENRLLVPTFVGNCVMFPEDPLGREGPKLEDFLRH